VAGNLNNWARLLEAKGDYVESRKYFERALDLLRRAGNSTSWTAAAILQNVGILEFDGRHYAAAETWERQSLEMRRKLGGEDTPALASSLIEVAEDEFFQGYPRGAEPLLRQALAIRQKKYSATHPAVIAAQVRLGEALIAEGEAGQAEPILRNALASARNAPFALLPWQVAEVQSALSGCLAALHRTGEAEPLAEESRAGLKLHIRSAFREPAATRLRGVQR
jgi:tetratricopeptide (TPR) repeat protein